MMNTILHNSRPMEYRDHWSRQCEWEDSLEYLASYYDEQWWDKPANPNKPEGAQANKDKEPKEYTLVTDEGEFLPERPGICWEESRDECLTNLVEWWMKKPEKK